MLHLPTDALLTGVFTGGGTALGSYLATRLAIRHLERAAVRFRRRRKGSGRKV